MNSRPSSAMPPGFAGTARVRPAVLCFPPDFLGNYVLSFNPQCTMLPVNGNMTLVRHRDTLRQNRHG